MDLLKLADAIADLRCRIFEAVNGHLVDEIDKNAFGFVDRRLQEMETECRLGKLRPVELRWPELSRIAEETDPKLLSTKLGGELIRIERSYQEAS